LPLLLLPPPPQAAANAAADAMANRMIVLSNACTMSPLTR
jgi:hypothetical protein